MRKNRQLKKQSLSIFIVFLMVLSLLVPGLAGAERSQHSNESNTDSKINSQLKETFNKEDKVTFLIKFKESADLQAAKLEAEQKAVNAGLSSYKKKQYNNAAVLSALKKTAFEEQQDVHSFLEEAVDQGIAEDIRPFYIVNGIAVTATEEVAEHVAGFAEVESVLKNQLRQLPEATEEVTPADEGEIEWNVDRVNAPEAWGEGVDGTGAVIASIDTGVQWDHPALKEHYYGYNAETGEVDHTNSWFDAAFGEEEPYDINNHGTHTIGTAVGGESDGTNQIGVAPGAKFIAAQAFQSNGLYDADLIAAGEWVAEQADIVDVVTNSWGAGVSGIDEFYMDMVDAWLALEIFPVFAAGNVDFTTPAVPGSVVAPANYPQSFAVGNTTEDDTLSGGSLLGPSPYGDIKPDVSAPGTNIRSSVSGDRYAIYSGTSMAAPAISGVVSMLRQTNSNLSVEEMKDILKRTATERTDETFTQVPNNGYGYGIVNAYEAAVEPQVGLGTLEGTVEGVEELPVQGEVSIEENNRAVAISKGDGYYSLRHEAGSFDVTVEAYGYETITEEVEILKDERIQKNFQLEKAEKYEVSGQITNMETGEPVANAQMHLEEDSNIIIENSDEEGNYSFEGYSGEYTLIVLADGYKVSEFMIMIDSEDTEQDLELEVLYTYPGDEIGYDSGIADGYRTMEAGQKVGVRMSLPSDRNLAVVTGGVFKFWDEGDSEHDGTEFEVEVWDMDINNQPNKMIAGPFKGEAIRDKDEWTTVDFDEQIIVESDFFIVYSQIHDTENSPALGTETTFFADRERHYSDGTWETPPYSPTKSLIRAQVAYEMENPSIISPTEGLFTSETVVSVLGSSSPRTTVQVLNNGEASAETELRSFGRFVVDAELTEGENALTVGNIVDDRLVLESDPVTVISDTIDPAVTIDSPANEDYIDQQSVTVKGTIVDANPDTLTVNGEHADVDGENYSKQILVSEGTNEIEVIATDKAGNQSVETITVNVSSEAPTISNITPAQDIYLSSGADVDVSFTSDTIGGEAAFEVYLAPGAGASEVTTSNMEEVEPGYYEGTWTAPGNLDVSGAVIEVSLMDQAGNTTIEEAAGKLFINAEKTDRIAGDIRYDTAIETSQAGWETADTVILARGDNFADALAGVPLAYGLDAPILLTPTDNLWEATEEEIARLGAEEVVILGGPNAVSSDVEAELTAAGLEVDRVDGGDRFTTAALIAELVAPEGSSEVAVVNGMDFPDALSIASSAAIEGMPILLAREDWISDKTLETIESLNAETTYVAGGPNVISEDLAAALPDVNRLEGSDRFGTNIDVLEHFDVESKHMYVATGMNYADALTGAVLAAKDDSSILLVHQRVPGVTSDYITDQELNRVTIFGGEVAVDESVEQALEDLLQ